MIPRNSNDSKNEQKLILDLDFFQKKNIRKKQHMKILHLIVLEIFVYVFPILLVNGMVFFR